MTKRYKIGIIKGDGIGLEIIDATLYVIPYLGLDNERTSKMYKVWSNIYTATATIYIPQMRIVA